MFHALVAIKQVPDTTNIRIDPDTGNLVREGVPAIMNPYDAHALAAAVEWKRKLGGKVSVISMGPSSFVITIREAVELGADWGALITDRKFAGADTLATSYTLATVIRAIHEKDPIDVIFFGKQAIDGDTAQVGPGVAVRLDVPIITYAVKIRDIDLRKRQIIVERKTEKWTEVVEAPLPALITCEKDIAEVPFAPLPDLIRSLRYEPEMWTADSPVAFDPEYIGVRGSPTIVFKMGTPPLPEAGEKVNSREVGVQAAVKTALDKADAAGILKPLLGGVK
ncbi:MAG TPA: electron transfer flavoprotein subunit beta/FixA family protein [Anaerolineae bacterium]|nr:electron transfer flavoprotein subunit beta/FixA family protein [Anaerolineae bacterium]HQK13716.1 electron transfer flavoprotein subunit beta/FixA family protein [Anaerolineae bacterium]